MPDAADSLNPVRVFIDSVDWFLRPRNTDWRYTRFLIPTLSKFEKNIQIHSQRSWQVALKENLTYLTHNVNARLGREIFDDQCASLDSSELRGSQCDVVFSHRRFPVNAMPFPVVWQNSVLDPEMTRFYYPKIDVRREIEVKGPLFARATLVHVSTEAEVKRLGKLFPDIANHFYATPMFVPDAAAANPNSLSKHEGNGEVRILFTGDQAIRKGLDILIKAFQGLPESVQSRSRLTIVSRLTDGPVSIPQSRRIDYHRGLPHDAVIEAMRAAHILAVPSRFESYGLVFLEAMSQGAVPVAPNWEVQREILNQGNAGALVEPGSVPDLRTCLERLIEDDAHRKMLAYAALQRFSEFYAPERVARRFWRMFDTARSRSRV